MRKPSHVVYFGRSRAVFYAYRHAEQFARALTLNGTPCELVELSHHA